MCEFPDEIQHVLVCHEEFYVSSTLPHEHIQPLYSYMIGCGDAYREKKKIKIFTYKEAGRTIRVNDKQSNGNQGINSSLFEQTDA